MEKLKTVDIKGRKYVEVSERLRFFRENYKGYSLSSEWLQLDDEKAICKAIIKDENGRTIAEGTAYEVFGNSFINKTSYIENCETSAWGRALGNLGIGIEGAVASANEVGNAIKQQEQQAKNEAIEKDFFKLDPKLLKQLQTVVKKAGWDGISEKICNKYKVSSFKELTEEQAKEVIEKANKHIKEMEEK